MARCGRNSGVRDLRAVVFHGVAVGFFINELTDGPLGSGGGTD